MKPLVEKLISEENDSFIARVHTTPQFEVPWHQHIEYELILFLQGSGTSFIGNHIGEFEQDDIFFLGSNLPHTFQKHSEGLVTSAVVVQFRDDFWGSAFVQLPECAALQKLFAAAAQGLKVGGKSKELLKPLLHSLPGAKGLQRLILLCQCLHLLAEGKEYATLSTREITELNQKDRERIDRVFQYTMVHFREPIQLSFVAQMADLSVPAFCTYFKKRTKKTYIDFLNEIRIGHACKLLMDTQLGILDVCFESGYNTVANFNKQFLKVKGKTPSAFRKEILSSQKKFADGDVHQLGVDVNIRDLYD